MTDEPNHPIDEPASPLEGGTVLPPAGETPLPPAVPAETAAPLPAPEAAAPVETAALATQAGLAAGANVPEAAAAPEQPVAPQLAAPQPVAPQPAVLHAAEGISPRVDEAPQPPAPAATAIPAGEPERESLVAMRRAPAKPAKSAGKKTKAAAKPAAEPAAEPAAPVPKSENMNWFILKVQSNREDSIREGLLRRVAIAGLDYFFGEVIVPTEKVTEVKQGRKRVTKRKLYPGYLVVQMEINDDTWFLVRETPGIGDFTGAAGAPTPMLPHEVNRILQRSEEKTDQAPKLDIRVHAGDRVKINEGTFENFEGEVDNIDATNGRVTVMINIFGRSTPVELEYWQIEGL